MHGNICFIGLGIMGKPMALNLIKTGLIQGDSKLFIYARRKESLPALVNAGAIPCSSPEIAAAKSDFCITMLSDTPDVEEVIINRSDGIAQGIRPDSVVIDMSTISPAAVAGLSDALGRRGAHFLDAPVSGGEQGAIDATLAIMVGGDKAIFRRALPLFESMGRNITHIGSSGAGQVAKACNQMLVAQTMIGVAEAFEFSRKANVDPARVRDALLGGFAASRILETHGKRMLNGNYAPGFKANLHLKDLRNTLQAAEAMNITLTGAEIAHRYLEELIASGDGELDSSAIAKTVHRHSKA